MARETKPKVLEPNEARELILKLDRRTFIEEVTRLAQGFSSDAGNPGSYACTECVRCANCMFCADCDSCYQCTHCTRCELCNNCSHCVECKSLHACAYCTLSENCTTSAYLVHCKNLSDCTYCFGCVGLSKKDFYILNVSFNRQEYFQLTKRLRNQLGIK